MELPVSKVLSGDPVKANIASSLEKISSYNNEVCIPYEFYHKQPKPKRHKITEYNTSKMDVNMKKANHRNMDVGWFQIRRFCNMNLFFEC